MITQVTLFRSDLFIKKHIGNEYQKKDLINQIKKSQQNLSNIIENSNQGCIRIKNPCHNYNWLIDEVKNLALSAIDFYLKEDKILDNRTKNSFLITSWANVNAPGSRNVLHSHKDVDFSAIYYLQSKDTGNLRFINGNNILGDCVATAPFVRDFIFCPSDGDLILWPGWVPHEVESNFSDKERINLVFNIKIT